MRTKTPRPSISRPAENTRILSPSLSPFNVVIAIRAPPLYQKLIYIYENDRECVQEKCSASNYFYRIALHSILLFSHTPYIQSSYEYPLRW